MKIFIDANLLIYLNTLKTLDKRIIYENFYLNLLSKYKAYTDVLVLDEVIYISWRKYRAPYKISLEFINSIVLPFIEILPLGEAEYKKASEILETHQIKPSDALHAAAMTLNSNSKKATENKEFAKIDRRTRIWISKNTTY